ncbi:hypothetical protein FRC12_003011 [Ceratobasidium sp. 428]|nr:hypothetical protein FRC09_005774 [Ceratobasidium sp. 395]KAG8772556.1 hypothetical protein FRC12_003011 [Ceratobasidium sp. 428]
MHFSTTAVLSAVALLASSVQAAHTITLKNNCSFGVGMYVHTWSGNPYTGAPNQDIPAKGSKTITVPDAWDGRICDKTASGVCANSCYGACSMTEFNMNAWNGLNFYDISNIQAYTVAQKIESSCGSVSCTGAGCPCNQAYRPGDTSGTCGGTGPVDQAVRTCANPNFTITYCP